MKKYIRLSVSLLAILLVAAQFISPKKNIGTIGPQHLFKQAEIPENIGKKLQDACMDCHSDHTNYQWYNKIAPVSWMVSSHINEGKKNLNFSNWGQFSDFDKIAALDNIYKEVKEGGMPLKSYSLIHRSARLTQAERDELSQWADKLAAKLMEKENGQ